MKAFPLLAALFAIASNAHAAETCYLRQELTARGMGIVEKTYVQDGDQVKKGDLLVEFDARMVKAGIAEAEAVVAAARAAEALAGDAATRLERLRGGDSVTEQQVFEARMRLSQAKAARMQAEAALDRVRIQLSDMQLRAQLSGTVRGIPRILGMFVQPGQSLGRIEANPENCKLSALR